MKKLSELNEVRSLDEVSKGDMVLRVRGKSRTYGKVLNLENDSVTYGGHEHLKEAKVWGATTCGAGHWSPINSTLPEGHGCRSKLYFVKIGNANRSIPLRTPRKGSPAYDLMF